MSSAIWTQAFLIKIALRLKPLEEESSQNTCFLHFRARDKHVCAIPFTFCVHSLSAMDASTNTEEYSPAVFPGQSHGDKMCVYTISECHYKAGDTMENGMGFHKKLPNISSNCKLHAWKKHVAGDHRLLRNEQSRCHSKSLRVEAGGARAWFIDV